MKHLIFITLVLLFCVTAYAKPHCQGFNNYDDRVTKGAEHPATSIKTTVEEGWYPFQLLSGSLFKC